MSSNPISSLFPFLLLLFSGVLCSAMIVPFMAFFLVTGLGQEPWIISVYSVLLVGLTVTVNRQLAKRIDSGRPVFPLVGIAAASYLTATLALSIAPALWTVLTIGIVGFGLSSSATSTMFSLGGALAERQGVDRSRFNAYMRATSSTAWMMGPALTFIIADLLSPSAVFKFCLIGALVWLGLWWRVLPKDITAKSTATPMPLSDQRRATTGLWAAAVFIFCLSSAHSLTFTALPLFYVTEVGLPGYAPGVAFSVKTFVEVFAIFATPFLIARFGLRQSLFATSLLAVIAILVLASVSSFPQMVFGAALEGLYYGFYASLGISYIQSFATDRPAQATAIYWNTLMISGLLAGPAVGFIAQVYDFHTVILVASAVAASAAMLLLAGSRFHSGQPET